MDCAVDILERPTLVLQQVFFFFLAATLHGRGNLCDSRAFRMVWEAKLDWTLSLSPSVKGRNLGPL